MKKLDRRKFPRIKVCNPVAYDCLDKDGVLCEQNMGIALDISQNGILLETAEMIQQKNIYLVFVDLKDSMTRIIGRVVFSVKNKDGNYKSGINFQGDSDENIAFATRLIQAYQQFESEPIATDGASV
ncbi:MAG: PilZ domain-containing protein [Desulfobacterales bacterium]|nr:PilZ domain-containing protein [Desulfobacterales bacterium]